ncbi:MAG: acyl-CoA dehydrogenase [Rhodospirillaceae bacterium]|jgi:acyl-CoA dehydrogenase|nr:acyl-CoA dehydrogenase [Rhodospirillaceae bacterium]
MPDTTFLDWPFLEDSHRSMARELWDWSIAEIAPLAHEEPEDDETLDTLARQFVSKLGDAGWLQYCVPAAYGGKLEKLDVRSLAIARSTLSYHSGLADFCFAMQGLGSASITIAGSEKLKQKYLPDVGAGKRVAAFALSEPSGGSDVAAMKTEATKDGNDYILNGEKTWISNAGLAHQYVVFARTGEEPGARGLSAFVVDAETPGLTVSERIPVIAPHPLGSLTFEDCRVPASQMLGDPGDGFKVAMATLDIFRTTVGSAALGFARRALDEAVARSKERQAFGQYISEFQLIQQKIANMAVRIDNSALLIFRSAWVKDTQDARVTRESSMAKLYATDAAQEVIDDAVQIFGGRGVVRGVPVEELYREIRALRIYEGTSEVQKLVIAGQVLREN